MPNVIVHPPADGLHNTGTANGRKYTAAPGAPIAVPDFDAAVLCTNGWIAASGSSSGVSVVAGPTAQRPVNPPVNTRFQDTTVGYEVMFDGKTWRHPQTGASV
jgi:hypothetical protein